MLLGVSSPASANGSKSIPCMGWVAAIGDSGQTWGGRTQPSQLNSPVCGNMSVRVKYRTYSTSPLYTTSWKIGNPGVAYHPGTANIIVGGIHSVSSTDRPAGTFPFTT